MYIKYFKSITLRIITLLLICNLSAHSQVYLKSWKVVEKDGIKFLTGTASNGFTGAIPERNGSYGTSLSQVENILKNNNIFDHEALFQKMTSAGIKGAQLRTADVLCWDIHARTAKVPLHELLGTKRTSVIRYGDARWNTDMTPTTYANKVKNINLRAVKLHLPGTGNNIPSWADKNHKLNVKQLIEYLKEIRTKNPTKIIAYDPHPQVSAAEHIDSVRPILAICDSLDIKWIEGPLPTSKAYWQDYITLRGEFEVLLQNEEEKITFDEFTEWMDSGAVDQICPGVYVHTDYGLTPVIKMMQWIKDHPEKNITINTHYPSIEHVHLAFTMTDKQFPYFEAPYSGNYLEHFTKVNLYNKCIGPNGTAIAPDWPGIYHIPWLEQPSTGTGNIKTIKSDEFKLFPNPASDILNITDLVYPADVKIYSITGQLIKLFQQVNKTFDISEFSSGLYFVHLVSNDKTVVRKLVKE